MVRKGLSRRDFLKGGAAAATVAVVTACAPKVSPSPAPTPAASASPKPAPAKQVELKWISPPSPDYTPYYQAVFDQIQRVTEDRVKFGIYPGTMLTGQTDVLDFINKGMAFGAYVSLGYITDTVPVQKACEAPWFNGTYKGIYDFSRNGFAQILEDNLRDKLGMPNVGVLGLVGQSMRHIVTTKKAVHVPSDLKGMKIRSSGFEGKIVELWGAVPVALTVVEAYEALQRGIVDGAMSQSSNDVLYKWMEVAPYQCMTNLNWSGGTHVYNKSILSQLAPQDAVVVRMGINYAHEYMTLYCEERNEHYEKVILPPKTKQYYPTPQEQKMWTDPLKSTYDDYKKLVGAELGQKVIDLVERPTHYLDEFSRPRSS